VDFHDAEASVLAFLRFGKTPGDMTLACFNFTPVVRENYRVGVPRGGLWREALNSDSEWYSGSGVGNAGAVMAREEAGHGRPYSLTLKLPPMGMVIFKPQ
jgi:1,4-alpha-glucan branching enzyme